MSGTVRILHLGNLGINSKNVGELEERFSLLAQQHDLAQIIDYLVICGDVSAEAEENEGFEPALQVLEVVIKTFVVSDGFEVNRVLIVPGPRDVHGSIGAQADFSQFDLFSKELARRCFNTDIRVDSRAGIFRHLKDLTLVGLPYWSGSPEVVGDNVKSLDKQLREFSVKAASEAHLGVAKYVSSTPTLLATAETPLLARGFRPGFPDETLRSLFSASPQIKIHLFGAGTRTLLSPEPFVFDHHSIGIGASSEASHVLRANLLELEHSSEGQTSLYNPSLRVKCLRLRASSNDWEVEVHDLAINGGARQEQERPSPYREHFQSIRRKLSERTLQGAVVLGFPGCGIPGFSSTSRLFNRADPLK